MTLTPARTAHHSATSRLWVVALLLCAGAGVGCRSKLSVKTQGSPLPAIAKDEAKGTSIPIPDGFSGARTFFQSRSLITVGISSKVVQPGERFSLLNATTETVLIDQQQLSLMLDNPESESHPSYEVQVKFYPLDRDTFGRFAYGENRLQLVADGGKTAEQQVTLRDFPIGGMPMAYFEDGDQRQDDREWSFQGELSPVARSVVTNGQNFLLTGMMTIVNQ